MEEEKAQDTIVTYFQWPVWEGSYYWDDEVEDLQLTYEIEECERELEESVSISDYDQYPKEKKLDFLRQAKETGFKLMNRGDFKKKLGFLKEIEEAPVLLENAGEFNHEYKRILEERPCLFLEFANLPPTRKCILDFANQYGMLKEEKDYLNTQRFSRSIDGVIRPKFNVEDMIPQDSESTSYTFTARSERMTTWEEEIRTMKWTVQMWRWLKDNDEESLRRVIHWSKNGKDVQYLFADQEVLQQYSTVEEVKQALKNPSFDFKYERISPGYLEYVARGDSLNLARLIIGISINHKLFNNAFPRLITKKEGDIQFTAYLEPSDLLTAMWVQFYFAVSGEKRFQQCEICHEWEDVTSRNINWRVHKNCAARRRYEEYRKRQREEIGNQQAANIKKPARKPAKKATAKKKSANKATASKGRAKT